MEKIIGLSVVLFTLNFNGFTQDFNTDPTFSTQNYKHPNKAKKARDAENIQPAVEKEEYVRIANFNNTSASFFKKVPIALTPKHIWQKNEITFHYKQSFKPRPGIDKNEQIRKFLEEMSAKNQEEHSNVESD